MNLRRLFRALAVMAPCWCVLPLGFAAAAFSMLLSGLTHAASPGTPKYGGLWWAAPEGSESGWAVAVDHQGDKVFAALATYDELGSPVWFVMTNPTLYVPGLMDDIWPDTTWQGAIYQMTGPSFDAVPFDPSKVSATPVGSGGFHFPRAEDNGIGTLYWDIHGFGVYGPYKSITREIFANPVPVCVDHGTPSAAPNYQGFWWNPPESGWGLYLAHQGDVIFIVWFTYDAAGKATWFVMTASKSAPTTYNGAIYRTTGPAYSTSTFDPSKVAEVQVGSGTLTFADRNDGTFSYTVNSVSQTKNIARQVFADQTTVCNE